MFKMGIFCFVAALAVTVPQSDGSLTCSLKPVTMPTDWITMTDPCADKMKSQVQTELTAAMTYFAMGAHFSRDSVNRPGFAKIFFDSASEEREHAIKIIGYLLMRGNLTVNIGQLIRDPKPKAQVWTDGLTALKDALTLEASVTRNISDIAKVCEEQSFNDYHLVDWLTGDFLTEQYEGQRKLAGQISNLGKMMISHGALGEFLFDKKLLNGESI